MGGTVKHPIELLIFWIRYFDFKSTPYSLSLFFFSACGQNYSGKKAPLAKDGVIDLSDWDFEKVKKVHDVWKFSKDSRSKNPNWLLIDTQA